MSKLQWNNIKFHYKKPGHWWIIDSFDFFKIFILFFIILIEAIKILISPEFVIKNQAVKNIANSWMKIK